MPRRVLTAAASLACFAAFALAFAPARADDDETPTIKVVMQKLHKGANSPLATLKKSLDAPSPDWEAIQGKTKDFVILGAALAKNDPPKGEKESWRKFADSYFEASKKLDDSAKAKDADETKAAHKTLSTSCMACHKAHKG